MEDTYLKLRSIVVEYLRNNSHGQLNLLDESSWPTLFHKYGAEWTSDNQEIVQQIFHDLYLERVIITGSNPREIGPNGMAWPFYRLTNHGKNILEAEGYAPYDPSGYLAKIRSDIPQIDKITIDYLDEGLNCFRMNYLFAAAVMLGCAAEKAMLLLIDSFGNAIADPKKKIKFTKEIGHRLIKYKFDAFWKRLQPCFPSLPAELRENLHTILERVFDLIRTVRNEAGHPTGKKMDRQIVYANLVLFPNYCHRVYGLINYFSENSIGTA